MILVGATGKSNLAVAPARAWVRNGARGQFYNVVNPINQLQDEQYTGRHLLFHDAKMTSELLDRLPHHCEIIDSGNRSWRFHNRKGRRRGGPDVTVPEARPKV